MLNGHERDDGRQTDEVMHPRPDALLPLTLFLLFRPCPFGAREVDLVDQEEQRSPKLKSKLMLLEKEAKFVHEIPPLVAGDGSVAEIAWHKFIFLARVKNLSFFIEYATLSAII